MLRIILDKNNDIPIGGPVLASGMDSAATALRTVFSVQAGEWKFNLEFGTRWRGSILGKFFDAGATRAMLAKSANTVPDHEPISAAQIDIDTTTRADARQANIIINGIIIDGKQVDLNFTTVF